MLWTFPSPIPASSGSIAPFFRKLEATFIQTWQEGAFGQVMIRSLRCCPTAQQVLLLDSTLYLFTFADCDIVEWKITRPAPQTGAIAEFFACLGDRLCQTWETTGHGHLEIVSQRTGPNKVTIQVSGAPSYRFYIDQSEIQAWLNHSQTVPD